MTNPQSTSAILKNLVSENEADRITLAEIAARLQDRGLYMLLLLFALPMALPLPYPPGFSSLVSLPLLFFTGQAALGFKAVYMPEFIGKRGIASATLRTIIHKTTPYLEKIERYLKPSMPALFAPKIEQLMGAFCLVLAGCIALPLSMLSNTIPAAGITLIALAVISRDGRMLLAGALVGLIGLLITLIVVYGIAKAFLFVGSHVG